jgi:hypothetical protein
MERPSLRLQSIRQHPKWRQFKKSNKTRQKTRHFHFSIQQPCPKSIKQKTAGTASKSNKHNNPNELFVYFLFRLVRNIWVNKMIETKLKTHRSGRIGWRRTGMMSEDVRTRRPFDGPLKFVGCCCVNRSWRHQVTWLAWRAGRSSCCSSHSSGCWLVTFNIVDVWWRRPCWCVMTRYG